MVYHLFTDFLESGVLCQIRYITMHLTVHFDMFYDLFAIGFQSAVEVVQVFDAWYFAGSSIKQLGGQCLWNWIISLLLPAGYQVVAILCNHPVKFGDFVWAILQVRIHRYDYVSFRFSESTVECRWFTVVTAEFDTFYMFRLSFKLFDHFPWMVGTSIVNENHFEWESVGLHYPFYPSIEFG